MWFRVSDDLPHHPKVLLAGNAAMGLWVRCGAWAAQHSSDGYVPADIVKTMGPPSQVRSQERSLIRAGLWHECGDGYEFHQWVEYQWTREKVQARRQDKIRAASLGNHQRWHVNTGVADPECEHCREASASS